MQALRDAAMVLFLVLLVFSVRVSPTVPTDLLGSVHAAGQPAGEETSAPEAEAPVVPARFALPAGQEGNRRVELPVLALRTGNEARRLVIVEIESELARPSIERLFAEQGCDADFRPDLAS